MAQYSYLKCLLFLVVLLVVLFPLLVVVVFVFVIFNRLVPEEKMNEFIEALDLLLRDNQSYVR